MKVMSYITSVTLLQRCTVNGNAVVEEVDQFPFAAYCIVRTYVQCVDVRRCWGREGDSCVGSNSSIGDCCVREQ